MQWTPAGKMQLANYQVGDVLTFHRQSAGFRKHEMAAVVGKNEQGLMLERSDGSPILFDPRKHKGFDVGLPRELPIAIREKLLLRANYSAGRLKNGDIVTVKELNPDGFLTLQDGRTIPPHFRQFTHGYATTSHSAQSKTVSHGILLLGDKGFQAANLKQAYVSNSRFSQTQTIFTLDKEKAFNSMARFQERPLALEIVKAGAQDVIETLGNKQNDEFETMKNKTAIQNLDWEPMKSNMGTSI